MFTSFCLVDHENSDVSDEEGSSVSSEEESEEESENSDDQAIDEKPSTGKPVLKLFKQLISLLFRSHLFAAFV